MDPQYNFVSRDDFWRLQNEMKTVAAVQTEHADRLSRLEKRQEDDGRTKSIWGGASPFPAPVGTPSAADPSFNPAAEAFKNFDQDQSTSMMGSLHLDAEEEPRRGTSRANSVRFDESALGNLGHSSRPSSEFFPMRSSSAFGSHPLTERSASHKSDGRQSSTHSARLNSMSSERASAIGPPPGLFLLGPLPSIIRCWLDTKYSNDTLLYAGICTGSYKSTLSARLVERIGHSDKVRDQHGEKRLRIPVYLPEATISESSSRSASPVPSLPAVTVDFYVIDTTGHDQSVEVLLGSDLLRLKNADILFSQSKLSMLDDESNRLSIPLVRPENVEIFKHLLTTSTSTTPSRSLIPAVVGTGGSEPSDKDEASLATSRGDSGGEEVFLSSLTSSKRPSIIGEGRRASSMRDLEALRTTTSEGDLAPDSNVFEMSSRPDPNTVSSWRRDPSSAKESISFSSVASNSALRSSRGKSMKVLRPSRSSTSRPVSAVQSPNPFESGSNTPRWPDPATATSSVGEAETASFSATESRQGLSGEAKGGGPTKARGSNPVGGASAFSWMNPAGQRLG